MEKITIRLTDGKSIPVENGTLIADIVGNNRDLCAHDILIAKVDNELKELSCALTQDCSLEFLDITCAHGFRAYQRSAAFLMVYAVKSLLGKKIRVIVDHSINKNLYCEIDDKNIMLDDALVRKIEDKMREAVASDLPIVKKTMSIEEGKAILSEFDNFTMINALKYLRVSEMCLYELDSYYDYFYGQLTISTGLIKSFKLVREGSKFLIQLPSSQSPDKMLEIKQIKKITQVFDESAKRAGILNIRAVSALNDAICGGSAGDIIRVNEALHEKSVAGIADMIKDQEKSMVLIAGPSSSGKTTFAERLCVQLRVVGYKPHVISMDNYFKNREFVPLDEFGKPNFESVDYLDTEQLNADLSELMRGESVHIPTYNFLTGKREYKGNYLRLTENDILVMEGIHGMNEIVSANVPKKNKFKIIISALTQLNIDEHNRIPTSDTRLIRRIVRDSRSRGYDARKTIGIWDSVMRGEDKNIFPYQEEADAIFNSALIYELCVLKQYAEPLLFSIDKSMPEYAEAKRLIKFLDSFIGLPPTGVPINSILREFTGGGCFHT